MRRHLSGLKRLTSILFKEPKPKSSWKGIWDASTIYTCMQMDHRPDDLQDPIGMNNFNLKN